MRLHLLYAYDSHLKALERFENYFQKQNVDILRHNIGRLPEPVKEIDFDDLRSGDIVVSALGGGKMNNFYLEIKKRNALLVALFPGIVSSHKLEDLFGKWYADLVLVNSEKDLRLYNQFCASHKLRPNGVMYGCSWFNEIALDSRNATADLGEYFLFIEQLGLPGTEREIEHLLRQLDDLAARTEKKCVIKLRYSADLNSPESRKGSLVSSLSEQRHKNIFLSTDSILTLISSADYVLGISSSALIEAILMNKKTYVVSDFGKTRYFVDYFDGSDIQKQISDLPCDATVSNDWRQANCVNPDRHFTEVIERVVAMTPEDKRISYGVRPLLTLIIGCRNILGNFSFLPGLLSNYFRFIQRGPEQGT